MTVDTTIPYGKPGVASRAQEKFGNKPEPRIGGGNATTTNLDVRAEGAVDLPLYAVIGLSGTDVYLAEDATAASGTVTFSGTGPANSQTILIGGKTYTFKTALSTGPAVANEILRDNTPATVAARLADAINGVTGVGVSSPTTANANVSATVSGAVVTVTALTEGAAGNSIVFDVSTSANTALDPSDDVLEGGVTAIAPLGILAQPLVLADEETATVAVYRTGHWNMDALTWGASYDTDAKKKAAFDGTTSPTIRIGKLAFNSDSIYP